MLQMKSFIYKTGPDQRTLNYMFLGVFKIFQRFSLNSLSAKCFLNVWYWAVCLPLQFEGAGNDLVKYGGLRATFRDKTAQNHFRMGGFSCDTEKVTVIVESRANWKEAVQNVLVDNINRSTDTDSLYTVHLLLKNPTWIDRFKC